MTDRTKGESKLLWSVYLASSWLWCIGMFFPVMLHRDYGPGSWLIFTIPNLIGAASIPWVLKTRESSVAFVHRYEKACRAFSWVTAAFQVYFVGWASQFISFGVWATAAVFAVGLFTLALRGGRASLFSGLAVWLLSAAMLVYVLTTFEPDLLGLGTRQPLFDMRPEALWLTPMMALGFLSCPYLDLTFHRVRQAVDGPQGKVVFALGFFVFFLVGLVFTFVYSHAMVHALDGDMSSVPRNLAFAVVVHMVLQAGYTAAEHFRSVNGSSRPRLVHVAGAGLLLLSAPLLASGRFLGMTYAEIGYRNFLVCYGLLAPAFIWVVVLVQRSRLTDGTQSLLAGVFTRRSFRAWLLAVMLALPCYTAAVLFHSYGLTWLGLPGVAAVLFVAALSRFGGRRDVVHGVIAPGVDR
jgi:hypothetical protein